MKLILIYLGVVVFDLLVITAFSLKGDPSLLVWFNALFMIMLTIGMAMLYEPKRYAWHITYAYIDSIGTRAVGRLLTYQSFNKMNYHRTIDLEDDIEEKRQHENVIITDYKLLSN